jgi:thiamine-phosphate pyrophosphorylase
MREVYRILDANFNRAREALRVAEDCGRFALNDPAITAMAKNLRSDLREVLSSMPADVMLTSRDTPGDIGTEITSPSEGRRESLADIAAAACKRLTEALRTIEEYGKLISPDEALRIERMRYNSYTLEQRLIGRLLVSRRIAGTKLCVLVSSDVCRGSLRETARAAIAGGADVVQLREKSAADDVFLALAAELRELADETGKIFVVNDRADIAAIVGADGVHLGQHDLPVAEVRCLLRPGAIVGRSTHNIDQASAAVNEGADYMSVWPMFETNTKDAGPSPSIDTLAEICAQVSLPVMAIGGINACNVSRLVAAGVRQVAVCSAVCCADDPKSAAAEIKAQLG